MDAKTRWGRLDVVINHVGILNETNWKRMLEINVASLHISVYTYPRVLEYPSQHHEFNVVPAVTLVQ